MMTLMMEMAREIRMDRYELFLFDAESIWAFDSPKVTAKHMDSNRTVARKVFSFFHLNCHLSMPRLLQMMSSGSGAFLI